MAKVKQYHRYVSSETGHPVTPEYAKAHPSTTFRQTVNVDDDTLVEEQPMPQDDE